MFFATIVVDGFDFQLPYGLPLAIWQSCQLTKQLADQFRQVTGLVAICFTTLGVHEEETTSGLMAPGRARP